MNIKTIIQVGITGLRFLLIKIRYGKCFQSTFLNSCHRTLIIDMDHKSQLKIGNHLSSNRGLEMSVRNGGVLQLGHNINFNRDCLVVCRGKTTIGDDVIFGPGCKVYDHDHDYRKKGAERRKSTIPGTITIGDGVWFGANCIILKGAKIGKNCTFGAGSVIKGEYPDNTLVIQKRVEEYKSIVFD